MTESAVVRYPDPGIKILDPRFSALVLGNAAIERIATGCRFNEGPVWFGDGRFLLWSDIPNDRIMNGRRKPAPSAFSAGPHITPTAIPATARVGW